MKSSFHLNIMTKAMISVSTTLVLLAGCLALAPLSANAQRREATERMDSAVTAALTSVQKNKAIIRVHWSGQRSKEGLYAGAEEGVLRIQLLPSTRIRFEDIEAIYVKKSKKSTPAIIVGGLVGGVGLLFMSELNPNPNRAGAFASGALIGGAVGSGTRGAGRHPVPTRWAAAGVYRMGEMLCPGAPRPVPLRIGDARPAGDRSANGDSPR